MEISEIREAVDALPRASNGKFLRTPNELRVQILQEAGKFEGGLGKFARQIGLSYTTLAGWRKEPQKAAIKAGSCFRRIATKQETVEKRFSVEGPSGLRVVNLSLSEIAVLFKEVAG